MSQVRHVGDHLPHSGSSSFLDIRRSEHLHDSRCRTAGALCGSDHRTILSATDELYHQKDSRRPRPWKPCPGSRWAWNDWRFSCGTVGEKTGQIVALPGSRKTIWRTGSWALLFHSI